MSTALLESTMKEMTLDVISETGLLAVTGGVTGATLHKAPRIDPRMDFQQLERGNFPQPGTGVFGSNLPMLGGGVEPRGMFY